jgi:hypothetical protein
MAKAQLGGEMPVHNIHNITDEIIALSISHDACAGTVLVIVNTILEGLRDDIDGEQYWSVVPPLINGYSLGQIIKAGSNNFRHYDEWTLQWVKEKNFTDQQNRSAKVIMKILGETEPRMVSTNVCGKLLVALCNGEYEKLESLVFSFAKGLVESISLTNEREQKDDV